MKLLIQFFVLFCAAGIFACQSGGSSSRSAEGARELIVGKKWVVRDAGFLEASYRENKGEPFVHTIKWFSASQDLGPEEQATRDIFSKATLTLDENKTPGNESGNVAHLDGLNLGQKQVYIFTATQEEDPDDRTIKLYLNCEDAAGVPTRYAFTILEAGSNKILLLSPMEIHPMGLVLSFETE